MQGGKKDDDGPLPPGSAADDAQMLPLPRVTIKFCTQCKWMLRAAYYAQELLSTFSTALGEVALQPSTGGVFVVQIRHVPPAAAGASSSSPPATPQTRTLWDRKTDGGFPETKELKRRLRDVIEPGRDLGHVDRDYPPRPSAAAAEGGGAQTTVGVQQQQQSPSEAAGVTTATAAMSSSAAERLDLAHRAAVSTATGDARPGPECEDCQ